MTGLSADTAGIANYTVKQDWRRVLDREMRAEGYDKFQPNRSLDPLLSYDPTGNGTKLNLLAEIRFGSGRTAVIVGTKTTLYRYTGSEDARVAEAGYVAVGYFDETQYAWKTIGSGFSASGRRWDWAQVNDLIVINNGYDLPVTYSLLDDTVKPIYELRESQVAYVSAIEEINSILMTGNITQIQDAAFKKIMTPIAANATAGQAGVQMVGYAIINSGTAGVAGNTLTFNAVPTQTVTNGTTVRLQNGRVVTVSAVVSSTAFTISGAAVLAEDAMPAYVVGANDRVLSNTAGNLFPTISAQTLVGLMLFWDAGYGRKIKAVDGAGNITVDSDQPIPTGTLSVENAAAYAAYTDPSTTQNYGWRIVPSMPGLPRRFGASFQVSVNPASNEVTLLYPAKSLDELDLNDQQVIVTNAVVNGGNLTVDILWSNRNRFIVDKFGITAANAPVLQAITDAVSATTAAGLALDNAKVSTQFALTSYNLVNTEFNLPGNNNDAGLLSQVKAAKNTYDSVISAQNLRALQLVVAQVNEGVARYSALDFSGATAVLQKASATLLLATSTTSGYSAAAESIRNANIGLIEAKQQYNDADSIYNLMKAADAAQSFGGVYEDLEDDGSPIIKMAMLRGLLAVYKNTPRVFIGTFTGSNSQPFNYERIIFSNGAAALAYPNTVIQGGGGYYGSYHIYAARSSFYKLDLISRVPSEIKALTPCQALLLANADPTNPDDFFAADNTLTREVVFCAPSASVALHYDYALETCRTSSVLLSAGSAVKQPNTNSDLFIMGLATGGLYRYGLSDAQIVIPSAVANVVVAGNVTSVVCAAAPFTTDHIGRSIVFATGEIYAITGFTNASTVTVLTAGVATPSQNTPFIIAPWIYHRDGSAYSSILTSGIDDFGAPHGEKLFNEYVLSLSSNSPNTKVHVDFVGGVNPAFAQVLQSADISSPDFQNLLLPTISQHYLGDVITVNGINNPCEIVARTLNITQLNTHSFGRRN